LGAGAHGWEFEGVEGMIAHKPCHRAQQALYRYWHPVAGDHFYTANWAELGWGDGSWIFEGIQGYLYTGPYDPNFTPLYRYWHAGATDHFYTTDYGALGQGKHGWIFEGIAGTVKRANSFSIELNETPIDTSFGL
jgi:hypothetical protein